MRLSFVMINLNYRIYLESTIWQDFAKIYFSYNLLNTLMPASDKKATRTQTNLHLSAV